MERKEIILWMILIVLIITSIIIVINMPNTVSVLKECNEHWIEEVEKVMDNCPAYNTFNDPILPFDINLNNSKT